jgi:hypothetical protein
LGGRLSLVLFCLAPPRCGVGGVGGGWVWGGGGGGGACERENVKPKSEYVELTQITHHCSHCRCYKGHFTAQLGRDGL